MASEAVLRVIVFSRSFLPTVGGLQYELKWFLDNLDRRHRGQRNLQAHFVYADRSSEPYSQFENMEAHNLRLNDSLPPRIARAVLSLSSLIRSIRPNIVHCHALTPDGTLTLLASRLMTMPPKVVVTSHGNDIVSLPEWSYDGRDTIRSRVAAWYTAPRIAAHIVPSQAMAKHAIEKGLPKEKLTVIPNGIPIGNDYDFEEHTTQPKLTPVRDKLLPSHSNGISFLSLASGRPIKNLVTLVEAFEKAKNRLGQSKLLLACQGASSERIRSLVESGELNEKVTFIGEVTGLEKRMYFQNSDVYCNVSHFESFGVTLLEAMKYGTAVLASSVGGVPEFIEHDRNGLLVSPTDVSGIAEAMVRLYEDAELRERLVEQAYEDVKQYSMSRVIDEHLALYERVASGSP